MSFKPWQCLAPAAAFLFGLTVGTTPRPPSEGLLALTGFGRQPAAGSDAEVRYVPALIHHPFATGLSVDSPRREARIPDLIEPFSPRSGGGSTASPDVAAPTPTAVPSERPNSSDKGERRGLEDNILTTADVDPLSRAIEGWGWLNQAVLQADAEAAAAAAPEDWMPENFFPVTDADQRETTGLWPASPNLFSNDSSVPEEDTDSREGTLWEPRAGAISARVRSSYWDARGPAESPGWRVDTTVPETLGKPPVPYPDETSTGTRTFADRRPTFQIPAPGPRPMTPRF